MRYAHDGMCRQRTSWCYSAASFNCGNVRTIFFAPSQQVTDLNAYLVFAGDGPLRAALESEASSLGISDRVRLLGFVNQSRLPETYTASDIFVLPSESEPFGVVVNEAMLCGCPVIVSDHVGARFDLVREAKTGFVFPAGDVPHLSAVLRRGMSDRQLLRAKNGGREARARMTHWSPADNIAAFKESITRAIGNRSQPPVVAETR